MLRAAVLACGARRLRDARERCEELLGSSHHGIRLNAAIALLNMRVDADVMQKIREELTKELDIAVPPESRRVTLQVRTLCRCAVVAGCTNNWDRLTAQWLALPHV